MKGSRRCLFERGQWEADEGRRGEGEGYVVTLQSLYVLRVIGAIAGMLTMSVIPFYRQWVCLREENRSKIGGVVARREMPRLACSGPP